MTDSSTPDQAAAAKSVRMGCLGLVGLALAVGACSAITGGGNDDDPNGDKYGAQDVCEQFVEKRLKAPATAEFSGEDAAHLGGGLWRVTGDVDAENSFGAQLRNTYTCEVQHTGDGNWSLRDLSVQ